MCGEVMHEPSGVIVSPDSNADGIYDNNVNCHWKIVVTEDHVIRYAFIYFDVGNENDCDKDIVWVG